MSLIGNLIPLVILFAFVGFAGWIGYQMYLYTNELADRGVKKMEKKNMKFTKDGMRVGVKEVGAEEQADKTQRAFVNTWNLAQGGNDKSGKRPSTSRNASSGSKSK